MYPEDCLVDRIRAKAMKITGVHGLNKVRKIMLTIMNPDNKVRVVLDTKMLIWNT